MCTFILVCKLLSSQLCIGSSQLSSMYVGEFPSAKNKRPLILVSWAVRVLQSAIWKVPGSGSTLESANDSECFGSSEIHHPSIVHCSSCTTYRVVVFLAHGKPLWDKVKLNWTEVVGPLEAHLASNRCLLLLLVLLVIIITIIICVISCPLVSCTSIRCSSAFEVRFPHRCWPMRATQSHRRVSASVCRTYLKFPIRYYYVVGQAKAWRVMLLLCSCTHTHIVK